MDTRIIAFANQKGGVGKTTTALNVGACLAEKDKRVLFIDMDPQANLTSGIGVDPGKIELSMYDVLLNAKKGIKRVIIPTRYKNLSIAPSHINLSSAEIEMVPLYGREFVLKKAIEKDKISDEYDFILIDCPPSLSLLTVNGLTTANELIIPMQAHHFALVGLTKLLEMVSIIKEEMNDKLEIIGVLLTMVDTRTNVAKEVQDRLREIPEVKDKIFNTIIGVNIKLVEAVKKGVPIIYYRSSSHGALAYQELTEEILRRDKVWQSQAVVGINQQ